MITAFNSFQKSILWKAIPVVTGLAFIFGLISNSIRGENKSSGNDLVNFSDVSIKNAGIPYQTFLNAYQNRYKELLNQLGQDKFSEFLSQPNSENILKQSVLENLIQEQSIYLYAIQQGVRISNDQILNEIRNTKMFQVDGKFDTNRFQQILQANGLTVDGYYGIVQRNLTIQTMSGLLSSSIITVPKEVDTIANLSVPTANVQVAYVNAEDFTKGIVPTHEQLITYYNQHKENYVIPATASVSYIIYTNQELLDHIAKPTEQEIKKYYTDNLNTKFTNDFYTVNDIQLKDIQTANEVEEKLNAGGNFAELASKYSEDYASKYNGGSLGQVSLSDLPKPIADVVANLKLKTYSQPIKSTDGSYHIVQLVDHQLTQVSFDNAKKGIADTLYKAKQDLFQQTLKTKLQDIEDNGGNINDVAKVLNLPVVTTNKFNQGEPPKPLTDQVTHLIFNGSLEVGKPSNPQPIGDKIIIMQVNSLTTKAYKQFDTVKDDVTTQETLALAQEQQAKRLEQVAKDLNATDLSSAQVNPILKAANINLSDVEQVPFYNKNGNPPYYRQLFQANYNGKSTYYLAVPVESAQQVYLLGIKGYSTANEDPTIVTYIENQIPQTLLGAGFKAIFSDISKELGTEIKFSQLSGGE